LNEKNTKEKKFSLGFLKEDYLKQFPAGTVEKDGKILAFTNIFLGAEKEELSADLMRFLPEAPNGVMDYLFIELMLWGKREGYEWFNLGMAPLSGLENDVLAPIWNRLGTFIFRHGEHFYNFQGLREYKEKFDPKWEARYLASPGGLALPRILINIASLISGGLKGVVAK
jgi:phosphatidylglycerol lysyltransferase